MLQRLMRRVRYLQRNTRIVCTIWIQSDLSQLALILLHLTSNRCSTSEMARLVLLWSWPCKMEVSSPHWHLVFSLAYTTNCAMWWQVAGRATLPLQILQSQEHWVALEPDTGPAGAETVWQPPELKARQRPSRLEMTWNKWQLLLAAGSFYLSQAFSSTIGK